ncbi:uncharacterized protein LOC121769886 isoform X1 [Salvia splendens]|uniref:uncharacterized protein LOC121769886 isoform X1 n=1 Tax=Salvia splendens TaxID=180675 RepID=UPI001C280A58|nr:uncharacterized protein LOC121769886 isoform X1 [Salvia splendens]
MDLTVASQGGGGGGVVQRDYRKGNWNIKETMTLIEAKRMDDERRMKRLGDTAERGKPAELRWKWVEDYCWRNGCFRSQNQCNDKWDNLMRDFKKVREFERKIAAERGGGGGGGEQEKSYWRMEKTERKDNNLPSNMLPQIYEALVAVVERKGQSATAAGGSSGGGGGGGAGSSIGNVAITSGHFLGQQHSMPSPIVQCQTLPSPAMLTPQLPPPASLPSAQPLPTVDSDTSEYSGSPAKRRRRRGGGGEGTSGSGAATLQEVGSAISRSASIIAEAIQSCEDREEERHKEMVSLHKRRLQIEESKAEINRQGINGLVDAINKLANSMLALAANRSQPSPK